MQGHRSASWQAFEMPSLCTHVAQVIDGSNTFTWQLWVTSSGFLFAMLLIEIVSLYLVAVICCANGVSLEQCWSVAGSCSGPFLQAKPLLRVFILTAWQASPFL